MCLKISPWLIAVESNDAVETEKRARKMTEKGV